MSTHECPCGCRRQVPSTKFSCWESWQRLPSAMKWAITSNYQCDESAHLAAVRNAVAWLRDNRPEGDTCRSCGTPILWARTSNGKPMPVNVEPSDRGNVVLTRVRGALWAGVLGANQAAGARQAGQLLHTSHFVDCPQAGQHRRRRTRR